MKSRLAAYWHAAAAQSDTLLMRWCVVIIGVILGWALLFAPYLDWRSQQEDRVAMHARQVVKLRSLLASAEQWHAASAEAGRALEKWMPRLFRAASEATAQADMVRLVSTQAQKHHLVLQSQRLLEPEQHGGLQRVMASIVFHGKRADILTFIDAIARLSQLVVLDRVDINSHAPTGDTQLRCRFSGFRLTGEG